MEFLNSHKDTIYAFDYCFVCRKNVNFGEIYKEPAENYFHMFNPRHSHFTCRHMRIIMEKLAKLNSEAPYAEHLGER